MSLFAVLRQAGEAWSDGKGAFGQPGVADHGAFMNGLAAEGLVLAAGPLDGTETGRIRVLLIAEALDADDVRRRLADDPWEVDGRITTTLVEPWALFVGALGPLPTEA
jgi:uncharacterized protein YciI